MKQVPLPAISDPFQQLSALPSENEDLFSRESENFVIPRERRLSSEFDEVESEERPPSHDIQSASVYMAAPRKQASGGGIRTGSYLPSPRIVLGQNAAQKPIRSFIKN